MGGNQQNPGQPLNQNQQNPGQQPQVVIVQDGTTASKTFTNHLAGGIGFGFGLSIIDAIFGN